MSQMKSWVALILEKYIPEPTKAPNIFFKWWNLVIVKNVYRAAKKERHFAHDPISQRRIYYHKCILYNLVSSVMLYFYHLVVRSTLSPWVRLAVLPIKRWQKNFPTHSIIYKICLTQYSFYSVLLNYKQLI